MTAEPEFSRATPVQKYSCECSSGTKTLLPIQMPKKPKYLSLQRSPISDKEFVLGGRGEFPGFSRLSFWKEQHVNENEDRASEEMTLIGEIQSNWRKPCPSASLSTTNLTNTGLGLNPVLRSERPATRPTWVTTRPQTRKFTRTPYKDCSPHRATASVV
jgi:hypothetical protein